VSKRVSPCATEARTDSTRNILRPYWFVNFVMVYWANLSLFWPWSLLKLLLRSMAIVEEGVATYLPWAGGRLAASRD
jgi:hypothetical protein